MSDMVQGMSVKAISELFLRVGRAIDDGHLARASGMCAAAADILGGLVAETRSESPVLLLPPPTPPARDAAGRFQKQAA